MPVAAQSIESPHDAASSLFHWSLFGPLIVLAVEGGILTPQFEFTSGWMRTVAQPVLFNLVFFSIALFVLLAGEEWGRISRENAWRMPWTWPLINLASYGLMYWLTLKLENDVWIAAQSDLLALVWLALAICVGASAFLTFVPPRVARIWLARCWEKAIGAAILGLALALLTPDIQQIWRHVFTPTIKTTEQLLQRSGYQHVIATVSGRSGNPVIGALDGGVVLEVTPACAEMESLAAFGLLGFALLVAGWFQVRRLRLCLILVLGIGLLYLLNAVRLFFLIDLAARYSNADIAVSLAHSRLSGVFFLGISLLILLTTRSWWSRPTADADAVAE